MKQHQIDLLVAETKRKMQLEPKKLCSLDKKEKVLIRRIQIVYRPG